MHVPLAQTCPHLRALHLEEYQSRCAQLAPYRLHPAEVAPIFAPRGGLPRRLYRPDIFVLVVQEDCAALDDAAAEQERRAFLPFARLLGALPQVEAPHVPGVPGPCDAQTRAAVPRYIQPETLPVPLAEVATDKFIF